MGTMTNTMAVIMHALYGLAGAIIGTVLLMTGHIDSATGVVLIVGSLGLGTSATVATNAVTQANGTVPASMATGGFVPVSVAQGVPGNVGGLGSLMASGAVTGQ